MKKTKKLFIIKKYVMATSAQEALRTEKNLPCDDVWVDDDWRKNMMNVEKDKLGFESNGRNNKKTR